MADSKKLSFSTTPKSWAITAKISWIGPWVSRIDWCEGHWFGTTYMAVRLSDMSSKQPKNTKNAYFACFWAYIGQPHGHIDWATSMPFASINSINPGTKPWKFHKKILRIGDFEKRCCFLSWPFWFFLLYSYKNKSNFIDEQGWVKRACSTVAQVALIKPNVTTLFDPDQTLCTWV